MPSERLILVGRVAGAFGVKGEIRLTAYTAEPGAMLVYRDLKRADGSVALTLVSGRAQKGALIARAREVTTREEAEALRGLELYVSRAALPALDEDEFYLADLVGLAAIAPDGTQLGRVKDVQNFGAGDLIEIEPPTGPSWWLPFTESAVPEVSLAEGRITVVRPTETE